jgi:hypothetical protein
MSKVRSPDEKKKPSYARDRRNTYGENQKSSRKNIPRSKQIAHQEERRSARRILSSAQGRIDDDAADQAPSDTITHSRMKRLNRFRKSPDTPLGEVVERKLRTRRVKAGRKPRLGG